LLTITCASEARTGSASFPHPTTTCWGTTGRATYDPHSAGHPSCHASSQQLRPMRWASQDSSGACIPVSCACGSATSNLHPLTCRRQQNTGRHERAIHMLMCRQQRCCAAVVCRSVPRVESNADQGPGLVALQWVPPVWHECHSHHCHHAKPRGQHPQPATGHTNGQELCGCCSMQSMLDAGSTCR